MRTRNNLLRYLTTLLLAMALCLPPPLTVNAAETEAVGTAWVYLEDTGRLVNPEEDGIVGEFSLGLPEGMIYQDHTIRIFRIVEFSFVDGSYQASWVRGNANTGWAYEFFQEKYPYYLNDPGLLEKASYANQQEVWDALAVYLWDSMDGLPSGTVTNGAFPEELAWYYNPTVSQNQTQAVFTNVPVGQYLCLTNDTYDADTKTFSNHPVTVTILPQPGADGNWYLRNVQVSLKGTNIGLSRTVDQDQVGKGDVVTFRLDIRVPRYQFQAVEGSEEHDVPYAGNRDFSLTDVLAPGFTLLEDSIMLESSLPEGAYTQSIATRADGITEITWDFSYDLIGTVSSITLSYQAQVNENMAVGSDENTATATLTYVKSIATEEYAGEQGTITESVRLWTYGVTIVKADGTTLKTEEITDPAGEVTGTRPVTDENTKYLPGAVFQLSRQIGIFAGSSLEALTVNESYLAAVLENQQKGQLYTLPIYKPDGLTVEGYGLYLEIDSVLTDGSPEGVSISGMASGTYLLVESLAPEGYNRLNNGIRFVIPEKPLQNGEYYGKRDSLKSFTDAYGQEAVSGSYELLIANYRGIQLPDTGGMGTDGFIGTGLLLMAAALFVFLGGYPLKKYKKKEIQYEITQTVCQSGPGLASAAGHERHDHGGTEL